MKSTLPHLLSLLVAMILSGCYVSKPLDHDVRISVNKDFPVQIKNEGKSNFSSKHTDEEYRQSYITELVKEFQVNHIVIDDAAPEFVVKIKSLEITESTKMDTVKDAKASNNGMIQELTLAGFKTTGTIVKTGQSTVHNWQAEKDKNESLTNNRSIDQMIAGENKHNTDYREKAFDDNVFVNQAGVCGKRAAVRVTNEIQRILKK